MKEAQVQSKILLNEISNINTLRSRRALRAGFSGEQA